MSEQLDVSGEILGKHTIGCGDGKPIAVSNDKSILMPYSEKHFQVDPPLAPPLHLLQPLTHHPRISGLGRIAIVSQCMKTLVREEMTLKTFAIPYLDLVEGRTCA